MSENKSIPETFVYFFYIIIAIAPFYAMMIFKIFERGVEPLFLLPSVFVFLVLLYEKVWFKIPLYVWLYGLFVLYTIYSDIYISNLQFDNEFVRKNLGIGGFLMLIIIENVSLQKKRYDFLLKISVVVILFAFIIQILQQVISPDFLAYSDPTINIKNLNYEEVRLESIYSWGQSITYFGLSFYPILAVIVDVGFLEKSKNPYWLLFIGFVAAILNKSRFVLLNYLVTLLLIPKRIELKIINYIRWTFVIVGIFAAFYFVAPFLGFDTQRFVNERLLEVNSKTIEDSSAGTRIFAYKVFTKLFKEHEFLGKGNLHNIRTKQQKESRDVELVRALHGRSSQIHVGYLSLFYYYGYVGGSIYLLFLITLTRKLYCDAKDNDYWGSFIGWFMFLLSNLTLVFFDIFNMGILMLLIFNKGVVSKKMVIKRDKEIE